MIKSLNKTQPQERLTANSVEPDEHHLTPPSREAHASCRSATALPITVFRDLPGVAEFEARSIKRDMLMHDERELLEADGRRLSVQLFGITAEQTFDPPPNADGHIDDAWFAKRGDWELHFAWLYEDATETEAAFWNAIGLDMTDTDGDYLCCLPEFGRQIVCAVKGIHPGATFRFRSDIAPTEAQIKADAEAWGQRLLH